MLHLLITFLQARVNVLDNERGATAVEYGLMVSLIAVVIIGTVTTLGSELNERFQQIVGAVD